MAKVLVIDDEPAIRQVMTAVLRDENYEVKTASEGASALAILASEHFDAVLLDMMMPGMDGLEFLQHLPPVNTPPVIAMTASSRAQLGAAVVAVLYKPFDMEELLAALRTVLRTGRTAHSPDGTGPDAERFSGTPV